MSENKVADKTVSAPVIKPASGPKDTAVIMTMADTGLKLGRGMMANTVRPTTPMAAITASGTSSLACGFSRSNTRKNGMAETARKSSASKMYSRATAWSAHPPH